MILVQLNEFDALSFPEVITQFSHQQLHDKVPKICTLFYSLIILRPLSRYMFTVATAKQRHIGTLERCLFIH